MNNIEVLKMKKLSYKNYQTNSTIFMESEGLIESSFNIELDGMEFESKKEMEEYIKEQIANNCNLIEIDNNSLDDTILSICIAHDNRII